MKVVLDWSLRSYKGVLLIENSLDGVSIKKVSTLSSEKQNDSNKFFLALPNSNKEAALSEPLISIDRLAAKLELLHNNGDLKDQLIIFGVEVDPFLPALEKIESSLHIIELLKHFRGAHCVVQTRSPHILLAVPMLRGERSYFTVCVGLETLSETTCQTLTPMLASPSERLATIKSLAEIGINTTAAFFPISTRPQTSADIKQLVDTLCQITNRWDLVTPQHFDIAASGLEQQNFEDNFHPLYDWQMARLIGQHFLKTHNLQTNQNQHQTPLREHSKIAA